MLVDIISHDVEAAKARIRFTHDGDYSEHDYDLLLVLPDMKATLARTGQAFDLEKQLNVIKELTSWMQAAVDSGTFKSHCRQEG